MCIQICVCLHVCLHVVRIFAHMCVCTYVLLYVRICVCIAYIFTNTRPPIPLSLSNDSFMFVCMLLYCCRAVIISGSPGSVSDPNKLSIDPTLLSTGIPILGICYGMQVRMYVCTYHPGVLTHQVLTNQVLLYVCIFPCTASE